MTGRAPGESRGEDEEQGGLELGLVGSLGTYLNDETLRLGDIDSSAIAKFNGRVR